MQIIIQSLQEFQNFISKRRSNINVGSSFYKSIQQDLEC